MKKLTKILREKSIKELLKEEKKLREEIGKAQLERKAKQPKDTNRVMKKRKELAVVLTILKEKEELERLKI